MVTKFGNLQLGDCLELIKLIPDNSVDLVLTDPPYFYDSLNTKTERYFNEEKPKRIESSIKNVVSGLMDIGANKHIDYKKLIDEINRVCKKMNALIWMNIKQFPFYYDVIKENKKWKWYLLKWIKSNPVPRNNPYLEDTEYCLWIMESGIFYNKNHENSKTYYFNPIGQDSFEHPTVKPLSIIKEQILKHSQKGDTVLDFYLGSGTTAVACEELERKWIGFEINDEYYNVAKKRLKNIKSTLFNEEEEW